jgi:hypothetical protein
MAGLQPHLDGTRFLQGAQEGVPARAGCVKRFATVVAKKPAAPPSGETAVM